MKNILLLLGCLGFCSKLKAQDFITPIFISSANQIDTVFIGFSEEATIYIDKVFGEEDISHLSFDSVAVRGGQLDIIKLSEEGGGNFNYGSYKDLILSESKQSIIPKNCHSAIPGAYGGDWIASYSTLFINNKLLPITIRWNEEEFDNECVNASFFTDVLLPYSGTPGHEDANLFDISLTEQTFFSIEKPTGIQLITPTNDTLTVLDFHLISEIQLANNTEQILNKQVKIKVFPNPTSKKIHLELEDGSIQQVDVYTLLGERLRSQIVNGSKVTVSVDGFAEGIYLLEVQTKRDERLWRKVLVQQ